MAATRTDIHRPGSPDFDPANYGCHGVFDLEDDGDGHRFRVGVVTALVGAGYSFADAPHGGGQCSHCGHWPLRYVALMSHEPTKTLMHVGETCLDGRFSLSKNEFAKLRKAAKLNRVRNAKQQQRDALVDQHPELAELLDDNSTIVYGWGDFLPSLADQFRRNGTLSQRQIDAAVRSITAGRKRLAERQARRDAQRAAAKTLSELPAGRVQITGVIKTVKTRESDFGVRTVMVVTAEGDLAGWTLDGTLPSSLDPGFGSFDEFEGKRVRFVAALKASDTVPGYAWFSRPTKAEYVD
jgi:hypothetical protein